MHQAVKDAIVESTATEPEEIEDAMHKIAEYGSQVIDNSPPAFTDEDRKSNAKVGIILLMEKAEELGVTDGQFLAILIKMAITTGKNDK